jgi:hypothetical protein
MAALCSQLKRLPRYFRDLAPALSHRIVFDSDMKTFLVLCACGILIGCGSTKQTSAPATASMTATPWGILIRDSTDANISTVTATLTTDSCANGVTGPACFSGSNLSSKSDDATPGAPVSLLIGVPVNPVPIVGGADGYAFNFLYVYSASGAVWNIVGTGRFYSNGNVGGTWQCDTSTPACSGLSGNFQGSPQ